PSLYTSLIDARSRPSYLPSLSYHTSHTSFSALSLHDALPISCARARLHGDHSQAHAVRADRPARFRLPPVVDHGDAESPLRPPRSEEHTSELQSRVDLVCRLLLEKKKTTT